MPAVASDQRRIVGGKVKAKACHVTSLSECARRYGANKSTKEVFGIVVEIKTTKTATNRASTIVVADYDLGGGDIKRASVNIRSVVSVPPEPSPPTPNEDPELPERSGNNETAPAPDEMIPTETVVDPLPVAATAGSPEVPGGGNAGVEGEGLPAPNPGVRAECHGMEWIENDSDTLENVNGAVPPRQWALRTLVSGELVVPESDTQLRRSRLEYFLLMFPPAQLNLMHRLMNEELQKLSVSNSIASKAATKGEILKFLGILILTTRFEFRSRASLWSTTANYKYVPAPSFGKTGMSRQRFDLLFRCLRFGEQPPERPPMMSHGAYRWLLVDDFVNNFNNHREATFVPGWTICVDESISRWYGLGGSWINIGLPHYVAIDRKPENGCEIQDAACGVSGVMLRLKLVKSEEEAEGIAEGDAELAHGTRIAKFLVEPWAGSDQIVCADLYFASVATANALKTMGLRFIGVVKTATRKFPMQWLSNVELRQRGDRKGLLHYGEDRRPDLMAFVWMDRDRRYFITNCLSLAEGRPHVRWRWRQLEADEDAERVELTVPTPKVCEVYYNTCAAIDQNNRHRQDTLKLEKKIETTNWATRLGTTILGIILVDTWLVFRGATKTNETQSEFYTLLAEELIDNTFDEGLRSRRATTTAIGKASPEVLDTRTGAGRSGIYAHLTPTKRKRRRADGTLTNHSLQGRCTVCKTKKTRFVCSECNDEAFESGADASSSIVWLCHSETGRMCFAEHFTTHHSS